MRFIPFRVVILPGKVDANLFLIKPSKYRVLFYLSIIHYFRQLFPHRRKLLDDMIKLGSCLLDVCVHSPNVKRSVLKMDDICRELVRLTKSQ